MTKSGSGLVAVIGGGPAGLMAAISAARHSAQVVLFEKGDRLGRKLLISGGGRCNVTNARGIDHIIENVPGNGRFLFSALSQWSNEDIITFFANLGVPLKEEDRGRMFPATDKAQTVLQAMLAHMNDLGVKIRFHSEVTGVARDESGSVQGVRLSGQNDPVPVAAAILCVGGCSAPETGSTGDGYRIARQLGHDIVAPYPTSVPLTAPPAWIAETRLQGVSLRGVVLTLYDSRRKVVCRQEGDMIFTHFGLSGPAVLRLSQYVVKIMNKSGARQLDATIDLLPELCRQEALERLVRELSAHARKSFRNAVGSFAPDRLLDCCFKRLELDGSLVAAHVAKVDMERFIDVIKAFPVQIDGTLGLKRATVTGGGISLKEIDPGTMASKLVPGLYFAGEVMDVHAHTGGYNITVAFSTGYVAGMSAAEYVRSGKGCESWPMKST